MNRQICRMKFEKRYPVPHGIVYSHLDEAYVTVISVLKPYCEQYDARWRVWWNASNVVNEEYRQLIVQATAYLALSDGRGLAGVVCREKLEAAVEGKVGPGEEFKLLEKVADYTFGYVGKDADVNNPESLYNIVKAIRTYVNQRRIP